MLLSRLQHRFLEGYGPIAARVEADIYTISCVDRAEALQWSPDIGVKISDGKLTIAMDVGKAGTLRLL